MTESTIVQNGALYLIQHKVPRLPSKTLEFARRFFSAQPFHRRRPRHWLITPVNEENTVGGRSESEGGGNSVELPSFAPTNQADLVIPVFVSSEQAIRWGSRLNPE